MWAGHTSLVQNMLPRKNIRNSRMRGPCQYFLLAWCLAAAAFAALSPNVAQAAGLNIPPDATQAIDLMYRGKPQEAVALARKLQAERPEHPLGYLIEADVLWWNIYCKW